MIGRLFTLMLFGVFVYTVDAWGQKHRGKTYGGSKSDRSMSMTETMLNGLVLTGGTDSDDIDFANMNKGQDDMFIIALDSKGEIIHKNTFGGSDSEFGYSVINTNDGGYLLTGTTFSQDGDFTGMQKGGEDIVIIRLNATYDILWKKIIGGSEYDAVSKVIETKNGDFVFVGSTSSTDGDFNVINPGSYGIVIFKINASGTLLWHKTIGGSKYENGNTIAQTRDGGYVITGFTISDDVDFLGMNKGGDDIFVIKLNMDGNVDWKITVGGSDNDFGVSIVGVEDGYIVSGHSASNDGDFTGMKKGPARFTDICVFKLSLDGTILWKRMYGGNNDEYHSTILVTPQGEYILTGTTISNDGDFINMNKGYEDIYIMKLDANGNLKWKNLLGGSGSDYANASVILSEGGYAISGYTYSNDGDFDGFAKGEADIFIMKLDTNGNLNNTTSINEFSEPTTTLSVYPNPFSNSTTVSYKVETASNVSIELLNTLGQTIEVLREDYTDIGTYQLPLNISTLSSGMYSVRMRSGSMNEVVPVWVVR